MSTWYYARGDQRLGPVDVSELRALAARGELDGEDLVWTDGMADWAPAHTRRELGLDATANRFQPAPAAAVIPTSTGAGQFPAQAVGYYVPTGGMPPRAAQHLYGHAGPTGDVGDWPLDDARVAAFVETMKLRKKVTAASQLYRALFLLGIIASVIFLLVVPFVLLAGPRGRSGAAGAEIIIPAALIVGLTILYFFAWRSTAQSRRWAPLTMGIVSIAGIALNVLSMVITAAAGNPAEAAAAMMGGVLGSILPAIFAVVSFRAWAAIPRYLAEPAWCQELVAASKL